MSNSPTPAGQAAAITQFGLAVTATAVGFGAQGVEQVLRPNAGKSVSEGAVDIFVQGVSGKLPGLAPVITEVGEALKGGSIVKKGSDTINDIFKK